MIVQKSDSEVFEALTKDDEDIHGPPASYGQIVPKIKNLSTNPPEIPESFEDSLLEKEFTSVSNSVIFTFKILGQ